MDEGTTFWGTDGFTFDDLGSIITLAGDTVNQVGEMAGWWETDPNTGEEYFVPAEEDYYSASTDYTPYIIGGSILLVIVIVALILWLRKRKKKG